MKNIIFALFLLFFIQPNAYAINIVRDITGLFSTTAQNIKFVGDITLGKPYKVKGSFSNNVHIPFSHEGGQWDGNSALGYHKTESYLDGSIINFTYHVGLGFPKDAKKEIILKNIKNGKYIVNYLNPDGTIVYIDTITISN